jgi:hypothetical protein
MYHHLAEIHKSRIDHAVFLMACENRRNPRQTVLSALDKFIAEAR